MKRKWTAWLLALILAAGNLTPVSAVENETEVMQENVTEDEIAPETEKAEESESETKVEETEVKESTPEEAEEESDSQKSEEEQQETENTQEDAAEKKTKAVSTDDKNETEEKAGEREQNINASNVVLYNMDDWAKESISIPDKLQKSFQLKAGDAAITSCRVVEGDSVNVTNEGLITPAYTTWYYNGNIGSTMPSGQPGERIEREAEYGKSVIEVKAGEKTFTVTVTVIDYAEEYADEVMEKYITENIKSSMSVYEKLDKICQFVAGYDYSPYYSGSTGMIVSGGGDCWASTSVILGMCKKLNISAWARNGNRDYGAGGGHMNALIQDGNDYYEAEAGFIGTAPRHYRIMKRSSLFCYHFANEDGIELYQYDGNEDTTFEMKIPSEIDGHKVVSLRENFICYNREVVSVSIPDTVTSIEKYAFAACSELKTITIPKSVTSIGEDVFAECQNVTIYCSSDSYAYVYAKENKIPYVLTDRGDLNGDNKIDISDVQILFSATSKRRELTDEQRIAADVNGDGKIDITDVQRLFQCAGKRRDRM